jgi:hypothetical protein
VYPADDADPGGFGVIIVLFLFVIDRYIARGSG